MSRVKFLILLFPLMVLSQPRPGKISRIKNKIDKLNYLINMNGDQLNQREKDDLVITLSKAIRIADIYSQPGGSSGGHSGGGHSGGHHGLRCNGLDIGDKFFIYHNAWKYGMVKSLDSNCVADVELLGNHWGRYTFSLDDAFPVSTSLNDKFSSRVARRCKDFRVGDKIRVKHGVYKTGIIKKIATNCQAEVELTGDHWGTYIFTVENAALIY